MPNELLERPMIPTPLEGQPVPLTATTHVAETDGAPDQASRPARRVGEAETWQQGAIVGLVAVSLFILWSVGVITVFSVMSAALLTVDTLVVGGLVGLTAVLFFLLSRSARRRV